MMIGIPWFFTTLDLITLDIKLAREGRSPYPRQTKIYILTDFSPNMAPKQQEMDGIVKMVYEAIESQKHLSNTLLVLCGDHGMNDGGNHGGSSPGETSPAMVFMSPKLKKISSGYQSPVAPRDDFQFYTTIEQSDVAPTLAGLLGFPVPKNNLGAFITDFLPFWPSGTNDYTWKRITKLTKLSSD